MPSLDLKYLILKWDGTVLWTLLKQIYFQMYLFIKGYKMHNRPPGISPAP